MRTWMVALGLIGVGCAAEDGARVQERVAAKPTALVETSESVVAEGVRERLVARIDARELALAPREPVVEAPAFDEARALEAIEQATGRSFGARWAGALLEADAEGFTFALDRVKGRVLLESGLRYVAGLERAEDAWFRVEASRLFVGLVGEAQEIAVKHLGGTTLELDSQALGAPERLGTKAFAFRKLGGLPVAGNRLVASYLTDGRLKTVRGQWPAINLARSRLTSRLTREEAVGQALELLVARGVNPAREEPIVLESFYELRPDAEGWVAVLRGAALVTTYGFEGEPGRRERHDFDL